MARTAETHQVVELELVVDLSLASDLLHLELTDAFVHGVIVYLPQHLVLSLSVHLSRQAQSREGRDVTTGTVT